MNEQAVIGARLFWIQLPADPSGVARKVTSALVSLFRPGLHPTNQRQRSSGHADNTAKKSSHFKVCVFKMQNI